MTSAPQHASRFVPHGHDRFEAQRGLGITRLHVKVSSSDTQGRLFLLEQTMLAKGGPPRHLHFEQEEWFYALEGPFLIEVGPERFALAPGDSILAPREVPHVWAYVGNQPGKILIAFTPAGRMEAFFHETTRANAMPPQDPQLWRDHGMELLGPPLPVE